MTCWDDTGESSLLRVFFFVLGSSLILGSSEHIDTILWDLQGMVREVIRDTDGQGVFRSKLYLSFRRMLYHPRRVGFCHSGPDLIGIPVLGGVLGAWGIFWAFGGK